MRDVSEKFVEKIIIIINIKDWTLWYVPSPKLQPLSLKPRPSANGAHPYRKRACLQALRLATTKLTQRGTGYTSWGHPTQLRIPRGSTGRENKNKKIVFVLTFCWPCISVINQLDAQNFCFTMSIFHAFICFEHHVLIIRRSKLHYTASGIITQKQVSGLKLIKYNSINMSK